MSHSLPQAAFAEEASFCMMLPLSPPPLPPSQWRQKRAAARARPVLLSFVISDTSIYSCAISACEMGSDTINYSCAIQC